MSDSKKNDSIDFGIFRTVLFYCITIIVMPVTTFFITKSVLFDGILNTNTVTSNVLSAVAAVIVLHFALGLFIYRAYFEVEKKKPTSKQD
ncbi:vacuolar ATPase assembly integral membrane protein VMA21 homolog [Ctenocephalides felis]|uniref:vacuolar ATPase assembly integral membrane protein VMA21 homolog n=1 Tax=Ctenocephalides felis TaxID=7515 RepID=UPI000E6E15CD|nr:vacuolar ATPase assembly integral membrane protein VMA21 homolog [Ctenocephalides felis]